MDREFDLREIRRLLGNPKEQRPGLDIIASNMFASEQWMLTKQAGVTKFFTNRLITVETANGTAAYTLTPHAGSSFGKAIHVIRDNGGSTEPITVPFEDFTNEIDNVRVNFFIANPSGKQRALIYRDGGAIKIHLQPTPTTTFALSVAYAAAVLDWTSLTLEGQAAFQEFSRLRHLMAAIGAANTAEWEGYGLEENIAQRNALRAALKEEKEMYEPEFVAFLTSKQAEAGNLIARRRAEGIG